MRRRSSDQLGLFGSFALYSTPFLFFISMVVLANRKGGFMKFNNTQLKSKYGGQHRFLFLVQLHEPFPLLHHYMCRHKQVSCIGEAGHGQVVQSIYEQEEALGGVNRFGLQNEAHLDEFDNRNTASNRRKLFSEWSRYWDLDAKVLMEYSPTDIMKLRFLDAMFPQGERFFLIVIRHPAAAAFDSWEKNIKPVSMYDTVKHWLACMEHVRTDSLLLDNVLIVESTLVKTEPKRLVAFLSRWLGIEIDAVRKIFHPESKWQEDYRDLPLVEREAAIEAFEERVNSFGYSLRDLSMSPLNDAKKTRVGVRLPSMDQVAQLKDVHPVKVHDEDEEGRDKEWWKVRMIWDE